MIKNFLKKWLMKTDLDGLNRRMALTEDLQREMEKNKDTLESMVKAHQEDMKRFENLRKSLTVTDLVRERMSGFNPHLFDGVALSMTDANGAIDINSDIFQDAKAIAGYTSDIDFLSDAKRLSEDKALQVIFEYVRRNQLVFSSLAGRTMEQVHAGGWSINGVELVRDEIATLTKIHAERTAKPDTDFDKHAAI